MNTEDAPTIDSLDPFAGASFGLEDRKQDHGDQARTGHQESPPEGTTTRLGVFPRDQSLHFNCETRGPKTRYFSGPTRGRQEKYLAFVNDVGVVEIGVGVDDAGPGCAMRPSPDASMPDGPPRIPPRFRSATWRGACTDKKNHNSFSAPRNFLFPSATLPCWPRQGRRPSPYFLL